jgi:hypothetical protein
MDSWQVVTLSRRSLSLVTVFAALGLMTPAAAAPTLEECRAQFGGKEQFSDVPAFLACELAHGEKFQETADATTRVPAPALDPCVSLAEWEELRTEAIEPLLAATEARLALETDEVAKARIRADHRASLEAKIHEEFVEFASQNPALSDHDEALLFQGCLDQVAASGLQSGSFHEELVQTVGQVVVERATRAAFRLIEGTIRDAAGCDAEDSTARLDNICKVLDSTELIDVIASPQMFLEAAVLDWMVHLSRVLGEVDDAAFADLTGVLEVLASQYEYRSAEGVGSVFGREFQQSIEDAGAGVPADFGDCVYRTVGQCAVQASTADQIQECDVEEQFAQCCDLHQIEVPDDLQRDLEALLYLAMDVFPSGSKFGSNYDPGDPTAAIQLWFALNKLGQDETDTQYRLLDSLEQLVVGLVEEDWLAASSGAVQTIAVLGKHIDAMEVGDDERPDLGLDPRLYELLAAMGQYSATYGSDQDAAAQAEARKQVIHELADRMVNRSTRTDGAVLSLGGGFGAGFGLNTTYASKDSQQFAFPVHLTLGVGLQTYHSGLKLPGGFHVMLSAFDLGKCVVFESDDLQVEEPDFKSIIAPGLTFGGWIALRETPLYLGPHYSILPFTQDEDGRTVHQFMFTVGIYVPLFDFN